MRAAVGRDSLATRITSGSRRHRVVVISMASGLMHRAVGRSHTQSVAGLVRPVVGRASALHGLGSKAGSGSGGVAGWGVVSDIGSAGSILGRSEAHAGGRHSGGSVVLRRVLTSIAVLDPSPLGRHVAVSSTVRERSLSMVRCIGLSRVARAGESAAVGLHLVGESVLNMVVQDIRHCRR
ncbi:hypothetical protein [Prosthecobacter fluviatilis]|uniref:Uncharacterized protein n=1 Tax=Prosthecobacter fluviatilis TaxID=445931 RepID=A0ABW0KQZ5_9BACT